MKRRVVLATATEAARSLAQGPALAAEVVKNCAETWLRSSPSRREQPVAMLETALAALLSSRAPAFHSRIGCGRAATRNDDIITVAGGRKVIGFGSDKGEVFAWRVWLVC